MTDLRSHYEAHGQGHVFAHFDSLSATEQQALLEQAGAIDLAEVKALVAQEFQTLWPAFLKSAPDSELPAKHANDAKL